MLVSFYNFPKRRNSTARPSAPPVELAGTMPGELDINSPVLLLDSAPDKPGYNYARIAELGRYYFIDDWVYSGGKWRVSLSIDPMATYREAIVNSTQYVLRSSSASNGELTDAMYSTTYMSSYAGVLFNVPWSATGCYRVDLSGADGVNRWVLTPSEFNDILALMWGHYNELNENPLNFANVTNPFDILGNVFWLPVDKTKLQSGKTSIGWYYATPTKGWSLGARSEVLEHAQIGYATSPRVTHPQISRGGYLSRAPYTTALLHMWPFGSAQIPVALPGDIGIRILLDGLSGKAQANITVGGHYVTSLQGNAGVQVPLSAYTQTSAGTLAVQAVNAAIGFAASAMTANPVGAAGALISGMQVQAEGNVTSTGGSASNLADFQTQPELVWYFQHVAEDDPARLGRPLCSKRPLQGLSGFCQCQSASVLPAEATRAEQDQITSMMNGGFYIE